MNSFRPFSYCVALLCATGIAIFTSGQLFGQTCNARFSIYDGSTLLHTIEGEGQEVYVCNSDFLVLDFVSTSLPSSGSTISFGQWELGGSVISNVLNQQYQFGADGSLTVSLAITDLDLCSDVASVTIKVLGQPGFEYDVEEPTCHGLCNGSLYGTYLSDNAQLYSHAWYLDGTFVASDDWVLSACAGDYTVEVTDLGGCTSIQQDFTVNEPPAVLVTIAEGGLLEICPDDDPVNLNANVSNAALPLQSVAWSWSDGLSAPDALVTQFQPSSNNVNQFLELNVVDGNGCEGATGILIKPRRSDLTGQILIDGAPCEGCELQCFKLAAPGVWTPWVGASTSGGDYAMTNIGGLVDCIMRLVPPSATYPDLPTLYYVNGGVTHRWSDATVLTTGCGIENSLTKDISTSTLAPLNGQANIEGAVFYQYTGKVQETDPIPGVDVVVEKVPPGNSLTVVTTDGQGRFNFDFMPQTLGDTVYNFYVDIPGVPMQDNYFLTVGANDLLIQNVHFCLIEDSTAIQTCSVLSVTESVPESTPVLSVHPNPSDDVVVFNMTGSPLKVAEACLIDLTGRMVKNIVPNASHFELSVRELPAGLYTCILRLEDGSVLSERLMVGR